MWARSLAVQLYAALLSAFRGWRVDGQSFCLHAHMPAHMHTACSHCRCACVRACAQELEREGFTPMADGGMQPPGKAKARGKAKGGVGMVALG